MFGALTEKQHGRAGFGQIGGVDFRAGAALDERPAEIALLLIRAQTLEDQPAAPHVEAHFADLLHTQHVVNRIRPWRRHSHGGRGEQADENKPEKGHHGRDLPCAGVAATSD